VIVIGVGNDFRRDDGAGPAVIDELRSRRPANMRLAVSDGEPARLLDLWSGDDLAVVVDAVRTAAYEPGHVREVDARDEIRSGASSHTLSVGDAARLGEALGRMPSRLMIYVIEGLDFGLGQGLSPPIALAVTEVTDRITALGRDLPGDAGSRPAPD
jgi:hydrogenase maturation protease